MNLFTVKWVQKIQPLGISPSLYELSFLFCGQNIYDQQMYKAMSFAT